MADFEYCGECNHLVSPDMETCPHCGEKRRVAKAEQPASKTEGRRKVAILFAVVVALLVIGFAVVRADYADFC